MPNIVILTGAGISAESGLQTFRASDGLWEGHRVEDVATPEAFIRNPDMVNEFYNMRRRQLREVQPNAAHHALAHLAQNWDGDFLLVTQNVDDLHDRAFLTRVTGEGDQAKLGGGGKSAPYLLYMHGELLKARCTNTGEVIEWHEDILPSTISPFDKSVGLRPHIVWFGEMPLEMTRIYKALEKCDIFVSIGTSGNVYPAAGFVAECRNKRTIELNLEPTKGTSMFKESRLGKATEIVPKFVEELLASLNS